MTEAEKQALALYEAICATGKDRPYSANSLAEMMRKIAEWRASNSALNALSRASAEVQLAFLKNSFEWLQAEAKEFSRFQVCQAVTDAIQLVLTRLPKPLPTELVQRLLSEYRQDFSMTRMYFPFEKFVSVLTREQITDEIRGELRRIHLQFAPTPTGKVEEHNKEIRELLAGLLRMAGEKEPDPGRGPWSQIVFDELAAKDDITRAGWEALLEHCRALEQTVPGAKWKARAGALLAALGEAEAIAAMRRWLALGPAPGQPPEARSPIEDSSYQKGVVWCVALKAEPETAIAIADFGIACLRKVPNLGAVSQKVGFACVQALGAMDCSEAVVQLTRFRARVKYTVARRLIEKSLQQAADAAKAEKVRLWHPLSGDAAEVQKWRERIFALSVRQPFRQAFREFYQITDEERDIRAYTNRFAGVLMRQHQFASLCRERGWNYRLMGMGFDGGNVPNRKIDPWKMHVEFYVDLPADRQPSLRDSALGEQSGAGINLFITSDQVRFYREGKEISLDDVPAIVYSEVMRDVDLFTSVCAVGDDEGWADQGERGVGLFTEKFDSNQQSAVLALRADLLGRVLPRTPIADRCKIVKGVLEVRGQLGTYRIFLNWGIAMLMTESKPRWLRIPQQVLNAVELGLQDLPLDLDHRTEMILRKAYVLANDWNINSPELIQQLSPR
jgi:Domain of unknown function (DUF4132)